MSKSIGLFGFGEVARGFYQALQSSQLDASIKKICIKDAAKPRDLDQSFFTSDPTVLLNDPDIDIIVELTDDTEISYEVVKQALTNGKATISANKKMIAENISEVSHWHQTYSAPFIYEASVGGSIPILQNLEQFFKQQEIHEIRAILNGSTNYILTQMQKNGLSLDEALILAQEKGFAESDPEQDISGRDALYKIIILSYHAFGETIGNLDQLRVESITNMEDHFYDLAKAQGLKIKSIATAKRKNGKLSVKVQPELISQDDELFGIEHENNAIVIDGNLSGKQVYTGKGAGSLPTGAAVLNDLSLVLSGFRYGARKSIGGLKKSA
ncbi:homoserine dehydrogenase [Marinoscillum sp.]|uniref:homoserine dehydrogenase n=1 Tax=Marinoscillum sp. TaxID=2024838 RepID=UPI003BAB8022